MDYHRFNILLYYTLKPLLPRSVQIFLRQRVASVKRRLFAHKWPIDPNASHPPNGWRGWPDGKRFALVLSHDVDTLEGYRNVIALAELEERMGFHSAFNFVPERYGPISLELLNELRKKRFEVGLHGLKHDGKLFLSKRIFDRRAPKLNAYLKQWNTAGFTSPSMHHNLKWLSELDIDYATSTFDTDPFEPQPDGIGTIFPFWVPNGNGYKGYVEMPYTLPQDSTLFIILREKTNALWKYKLDWIAAKGGMVLLNTHPDYMKFTSANLRYTLHYPASHYADFLDYVRTRYGHVYWHAKPAQVAAYVQEQRFRETI